MRTLKEYIQEGILDNANTALKNADDNIKYNYFPKTNKELKNLVNKLIKERGNDADLNDIYTGYITDMSNLFARSEFNGDISKWNVSKVTNMYLMFQDSNFNGDISKWKINKDCNTKGMFDNCLIKDKYKPKVI